MCSACLCHEVLLPSPLLSPTRRPAQSSCQATGFSGGGCVLTCEALVLLAVYLQFMCFARHCPWLHLLDRLGLIGQEWTKKQHEGFIEVVGLAKLTSPGDVQ